MPDIDPMPAAPAFNWRFFTLIPILIVTLAYFLTSPSYMPLRALRSLVNINGIFKASKENISTTTIAASSIQPSVVSSNMTRPPVYFFSHGGPDVQFKTEHPVYSVLQNIGKEITQKVKPKAVVVFSAHWQSKKDEIHINNAVDTELIYE